MTVQSAAPRDAMLALADALESSSNSVNELAFQPLNAAIRELRRLSREIGSPIEIDTATAHSLISELRTFAGTVSEPASTLMRDAAGMFLGICKTASR